MVLLDTATDLPVTAHDLPVSDTLLPADVAMLSDALSARLGASGWARAAVLTETAAPHA